MKKSPLGFILLLLFLCSCSNREDQAKKLIKNELSTTMNDYNSYEGVEFGKLDSTFSDNHKFTGYQLRHKFRGKNALGGVILNHYSYYFDVNLTKIIRTQDNFALQEELERSLKENKALVEKYKQQGL
jgi:hypothetical protein